MGLRLQRHLGPVESMLAGQYTTETVSGGVALACPLCGTVADMEPPHTVSASGIVSHVWACAHQACPFLEFISLESWDE